MNTEDIHLYFTWVMVKKKKDKNVYDFELYER